MQTLRTIHNVETQFEAMNSRFGTLKELAEARLIDQNYANGDRGQWLYLFIFRRFRKDLLRSRRQGKQFRCAS